MTEEVWRHTEQRGFYTKLLSPASAILIEHGLDSKVAEQIVNPPPQFSSPPEATSFNVPPPMTEGILFDVCEIFRGSGNWSAAHSAQGLSTPGGFDLDGRRLRCHDLQEASTMHELISLALRRVVRDFHAGVPCLSFGTFRRPQVRSNRFPHGFDPSDLFTAYHNRLAQRACFVLDRCFDGWVLH